MLKHFNGISAKYRNRDLTVFAALGQAGHSLFHPAVDTVRTMLAKVTANLLTPQRGPSGS